jgi:hypothetical protein
VSLRRLVQASARTPSQGSGTPRHQETFSSSKLALNRQQHMASVTIAYHAASLQHSSARITGTPFCLRAAERHVRIKCFRQKASQEGNCDRLHDGWSHGSDAGPIEARS